MPEPDWSVWVHDMKTGAPLQRVQVQGDAPFSASLSGDGESEVTIVTNDAAHPWEPGQIADAFTPNARMLVRWWGVNGGGHADDIPVTAHKIESYDYDRDAGKVNVKAVDALDFAEWRLVDGVGADLHSTLTITNRSAAGAVRAALGRMMQWNPDWALPIDLPDDGAGDFSGAWSFWEGHLISDVLQEIRERTGVEIYLDPYATPDGGVRFRTLVGKPISIGGAHFHLDAAKSPLSAVVYRVNGVNQVTGIQGIGQGTGEDQQTRASKGVVKIPIRDSRKTFPDMVGDELQQAADTYYAQNVDPVVQWDIGSFTIDADFGPELVRPGRQLSLEVRGDVVIPDGVYTVRVVKVSGGSGRVLKPEVQ